MSTYLWWLSGCCRSGHQSIFHLIESLIITDFPSNAVTTFSNTLLQCHRFSIAIRCIMILYARRDCIRSTRGILTSHSLLTMPATTNVVRRVLAATHLYDPSCLTSYLTPSRFSAPSNAFGSSKQL